MIRSTFAGFTTAQLAMGASQRSIDVTGQNIANINTEGYTRQRLDIASLNLRNGSFYNSSNNTRVGYGVDMTGISQLRDPFLDAQYRSQIAKLGTTDAHAAGLEKLQVAFDESTTSGVRDALLNLSNALQTLSKDDGYTKENDTVVRSRMQIIVNLFREKAVSLQDIKQDVRENFESTDVRDLNAMLENIAELNTSIKNSQVLGNPALELMDERNKLLDELGSYLPINVDYKLKHIGEGYAVQVLDVSFTDDEGINHRLVSDGRYGRFRTDISDDPVTLTLTDADGYTLDVTEKITDGTLKGTLDFMNMSGDFNDTDFKGIGYYEKVLDSLVAKFATEFNKANKKAAEPETVTGADGKLYYEYESDKAGAGKIYQGEDGNYYSPIGTKYEVAEGETLTPVYKPDTQVEVPATTDTYLKFEDVNGNLVYENQSDNKLYIDNNGTPSTNLYTGTKADLNPVMDSTANPPVQETVTVTNGPYLKYEDPTGTTVFQNKADGKYYLADSDGNPSTKEYTGEPKDLTAITENDRPLFEKIDNSKGFSALNIKIASDWLNGTYGITNSNNTVNNIVGSSANENIVNMINMLSTEYPFTSVATDGPVKGMDVKFYSGTFFSCFANIETTLGIDISSATTMLDNQITVLNQTANSRDGISGVQLDEEGMNLIHYNQSYSAAARLMTTLDEMLDKLINGTGVVGR